MNEMNLNYQEIKNNIRTRFQNMQTDYVAIGYYLRQVLNNELYLEDGYKNIHEFAQAEFGMKKKDIERELKVGSRIVDNIYKEHGFDQRPVKASTHYPPELLEQWDELHRRYGTCQK